MNSRSMKKSKTSITILLLIALLVLAAVVKREREAKVKSKIVAHFPFTFGTSVDPTNIFTVGQQVIAEHTFAFLARRSINRGFDGSAASVQIDSTNNFFRAQLMTSVKSADGKTFDKKDLCSTLKTTVLGTTHAPYKSLLKEIVCDDTGVSVFYKTLPTNIRYLLTLPDFCLYRANEIPLNGANMKSATGPYYPEMISNERVVLKRNKHFPKELVANDIEEAELVAYSASEASLLIEKLDFETDSAAYFFGYSINDSDIERLKNKNFEIEISPQEWLMYFKVSDTVPQNVKSALNSLTEKIRAVVSEATLGEPTETLAQYGNAQLSSSLPSDLKALEGVTLFTMSNWSSTPAFRKILDVVRDLAPGFKIVTLPREKMSDLYSNKVPIGLNVLGLSPVDKLSHLSFLATSLEGFSSIISVDEIAAASAITDEVQLNEKLRQFDHRLQASKLILPVAHFPGVIAVSKQWKVNRDLAFDWGIQLWSIQSR